MTPASNKSADLCVTPAGALSTFLYLECCLNAASWTHRPSNCSQLRAVPIRDSLDCVPSSYVTPGLSLDTIALYSNSYSEDFASAPPALTRRLCCYGRKGGDHIMLKVFRVIL